MPSMKSLKSKRLIVLGSIVAAIILIASLAVRIELTKAIDENAQLKERLEELREENARLEIEYESLIDLPELEEYAKNVLGMQKPESERIIEIDVSTQDKSVILKDTNEIRSDKLVSSILEYLSEVKCKFN